MPTALAARSRADQTAVPYVWTDRMDINPQPAAGAARADGAPKPGIRARLGKLPGLILGAAGVFAVGVYDNLKGGVVEAASDWVRYHWSGSVFVIELSEPVQIAADKVVLLPVGDRERALRPDRVSLVGGVAGTDLVRYIEVTVYPGQYFVTLERGTPEGTLRLSQQPISLSKPETFAKLNTAAAQWSSPALLTTLPQGTGGGPALAAATGTRWTAAPSDTEALATAPAGRAVATLRAALGQLGVWEEGGESDRKAIGAYWRAVAAVGGMSPSPGDDVYGRWGGAFLAWAVAQGGGTPPMAAPAFRSWQSWGTAIEPSGAKPGHMVIVRTGQTTGPTPSGLMVGVYLRRRADCVEMVTGNMANRVAVTCVRGETLAFRSAD